MLFKALTVLTSVEITGFSGQLKLGSGQPCIYRHFPLLAGLMMIGNTGKSRNVLVVMAALCGLSFLHAFRDRMVENNAKAQSI